MKDSPEWKHKVGFIHKIIGLKCYYISTKEMRKVF